jgi:hypothetical protein
LKSSQLQYLQNDYSKSKPILNVLQVPGFSQVHWILLILIFMASKRMDHASWKRMQDSILLHAIKILAGFDENVDQASAILRQ